MGRQLALTWRTEACRLIAMRPASVALGGRPCSTAATSRGRPCPGGAELTGYTKPRLPDRRSAGATRGSRPPAQLRAACYVHWVDGVGPQTVESLAGREATARPFVGRTRELADLSIAIDAAGSGAGSLVLVTGEPGIGKTRLIAELAHSAADGGLAVASGRCWEEGGAPPYWPWIQVLRALGGDLDQLAAAAEPRVPLPGGTGGITPEGERIRLFDAVGRFLADAAADRPLLVTLDDMHAADEPSLLLLRFLAEALTGAGVVLVASYRDGEPRVREMGGAFSELARAGQRLALQGLGSEDIGAYLATVTGASPTPELVARLHEITGRQSLLHGRGDATAPRIAGRARSRHRRPVPADPRGGARADPPARGRAHGRGGGDAADRGRDRTRVRPAGVAADEPAIADAAAGGARRGRRGGRDRGAAAGTEPLRVRA